jgi:hypothetical protein
MGLLASTGVSQHPSADVAAQQAVAAAFKGLEGQQPDLALVFASVEYAQDQMLAEIKRQLPPTTQLLGCSAAGEITENGFHKKAVAIMLINTQGIKLATMLSTADTEHGQTAGQQFGKKLQQILETDPTVACFLTDGLTGDGAELVEGLHHALPGLTTVAGAAAGDDLFFRKTYQYYDGKVHSAKVTGFGLAGSIKAGVALAHGWQNVGMSKRITQVRGNKIIEIDGKPAVNFYETYFGKDNVDKMRRESLARLAITYPLGVRAGESDVWLVRYPLSVDEHGALQCGAAIPNGAAVDLMLGGRDQLIKAAKDAATEAMAQLGGTKPKAAIVFDSVARSRLLGLHIHDELEAVQAVIGEDVPTIGFASYAEFGPALAEKGVTNISYQNESMAILLLGDK